MKTDFIFVDDIRKYPEYYCQMFGIRKIAQELGGDIYHDNCDEWLLVVQEGRLLGFSGYDKFNDKFTFKRSYVMPEFRGLGIYKEMFQRRYNRALELGCKILQAKTSPMSRRIFEKNGFGTQTKIPKRFIVYRKFL